MTDAFGEELRRRRERAGLSVSELARRVHYSKGHLSNIENGRKHATIDLAERCDTELGAEGHLIELLRAQPEPLQTSRSVKPAQLPAGIPNFVGRSTTIAQLDSLLAATGSMESIPIIAIDGVPGVGKTNPWIVTHSQATERDAREPRVRNCPDLLKQRGWRPYEVSTLAALPSLARRGTA